MECRRYSTLLCCAAQVAFEKMKVHLSKKMFGDRVNWADGNDAYAKALPAKALS